MSPVNVIEHIRFLTSTFHMWFCSGGPTSITSFSGGLRLFSLVEASKTILNLILSAD